VIQEFPKELETKSGWFFFSIQTNTGPFPNS